MSVFAAGRRSLSRTSTSFNIVTYNVLQYAYDFFEVSFSRYFSEKTDPDDDLKANPAANQSLLILWMMMASPLAVLITMLCIGASDEGSRTRVQHWIVPEDLSPTERCCW